MFTHVKCEIGPKLRKPSFFFNFWIKKLGTYVKHLYINSICTKFEGRRWKIDSVIDHASWPKIAQVSPNFHVFCPNDLEDEGQGHPFSIAIERYLICIFCANLVKIYPLLFDLSCGQAQNAKKTHFLTSWPWPLTLTSQKQSQSKLDQGQPIYQIW